MTWSHFAYFALSSLLCWTAGACVAWKDRRRPAVLLTLLGLFIFGSYIVSMWVTLQHPPLRTMGETRLWYSLFLPLAGLSVYVRRHYRWILTFSTVMTAMFIGINLFKPEIHSKTLMPALQSPWFAPHVIVYMFAYAMLGASFLMALYLLFSGRWKERGGTAAVNTLVSTGLAFMTIGMLFGALWAKEVWGHYWSWDPKETWAAATWLSYLAYVHYRLSPQARPRVTLWMLVVSFALLQMCWWGINYLPAAQGVSVHTYGS